MKKNKQEQPIIISQDKYFYLAGGSVLKDLKELVSALEKMTKEMFDYHVTKEKNDFANWIENVFNDKKLATDIRKAKTAKIAAQKIKTRIKYASQTK
jgi:hypothetical protein